MFSLFFIFNSKNAKRYTRDDDVNINNNDDDDDDECDDDEDTGNENERFCAVVLVAEKKK